jgi:hypothetical protein
MAAEPVTLMADQRQVLQRSARPRSAAIALEIFMAGFGVLVAYWTAAGAGFTASFVIDPRRFGGANVHQVPEPGLAR